MVTVDVHDETFSLSSVTVNVTVFAPMSEQVKSLLSILNVIPQASEEPLSISAATIVALPVASS